MKFGVSFFFSIFTVLLQTCLKFGILLLHNILLLKIKSFQSLMNILRFSATILFAPKCILYLAVKSHINGRWHMSSYILSSWSLYLSSTAPEVSCIKTFIIKSKFVCFEFDDIVMTKRAYRVRAQILTHLHFICYIRRRNPIFLYQVYTQ